MRLFRLSGLQAMTAPLLNWRRVNTWWPKHNRYPEFTVGDDMSRIYAGYRLKQILEDAWLDLDDGITVIIEVVYEPDRHAGIDVREKYCGFSIVYKANTNDEKFIAHEGFETIDDAKAAAEAALVELIGADHESSP
jgi:hypothetical protein